MGAIQRTPRPPRVSLFEEHGETSRYVGAEIDVEGNLVLSGQDVGKDPQEIFGDSDYEWWVTVAREHVGRAFEALIEESRLNPPEEPEPWNTDETILALLKRLYGGRFSATTDFTELLKSKGIPYRFDSYA